MSGTNRQTIGTSVYCDMTAALNEQFRECKVIWSKKVITSSFFSNQHFTLKTDQF